MIPFSVCGEKSGLGIYFFDQHGQRSSDDESGILATDGDKQIIWYSKGAVKVLRNISCPNKPIDALICNFAGAPGSINARTSAIAILLTSELLQLHLFNGETFDIHLPVPMTKIFSSSQGLLLQRTTTSYEQFRPVASDSSNINSLFSSRGSHLDREDSFDVKLWLDEANDANEKKIKQPALSVMESPSLFRSDERHFSPQLSVANSLEKIIRNGGSGSGPESAACFYSLAHPTAPVRPVRMINGDFISKFGINRRSRRFTADSTVEANIDFQSEDFSMNLQSPSTTYTRHDSFNKGSGRKGGGVSGYRAPSRCAEYSLLAVEGNLLCTVQRGTGSITLWYISHMTPSTGQGEGRDKVELERLQDVTNISLATSTTVANSSVLEGRHFILRDQRETTTSPSSFLSLSASVSGNNRLSQISGHSNSNTISMNVSHSSVGSGASSSSSAGGMITSALMPFESLSGPSISLERERDLRGSKRANSPHSTYGTYGQFPAVYSGASSRFVPLLPLPGSDSNNIFVNDLTINTENFSASRSHRTTPDQRTHAQSQGTPNTPNMSVLREEDYTHCSDTSVTALISIDLKSLGGVWSSCPSSSAHEKNSSMGAFESNLHVTFSGGEESLIVSSTSSAAESALTPTISLRMLPSAPHSTPLDGCVRSIAHMQFCLDGHGHANRGTAGQLPSIQENVAGARPRLGRSKGSLGSIPISILTYGRGAAENQTVHNAVGRKHEEGVEGAVGIEVTVLIGGQPVGARSPLSYTDILKMVESTTIPPSSASSTSMHPRNASVHSLGISGSRLLCVDSSSSHPGGSIVLSGPSELFEGGGLDGINGIVAQVICSTFTALQIGGRKNDVNARKVNGAVRRRTSDEAKGYRYGTYTNDEEEEGSDDVLTSAALVAQTVALMLIIQSEVGPIHVLRLLLFAAFAVSSGDRKSPQSKESSAKFDLSPACEAFFRLCSYTASKKCRRLPESEECVTIRSVLFDIYHSVLQDLLLRGKGTSFGKEHEGVEVLRGALLSVSEGIRNSLYSVAFNDRSAALTDPTNAMSIGDHCADYAPMRDSDNLGFESGPIATGNGSESSSDWAVRVRECAEGYSAYYKSIGVGRGCNPRNEDAGSGSCDSLASPQSLFIVGDEDGEERRFSFTGSHSVPHALDWVVKCITVVSQSNIRKSSFNVGAECRSDIPTLYTSESIHGDRRGDRNRVNNQGDEGVADLICDPADEIYPSIAFTRAFFSLLSNLKVGVPLSLQSAPQTKTDSGIGLINVANAFIRASGGNLSTLSLLPPPIRVFVELALHQSKEAPFFPLEQGALSPALAWPSSVLVMIGRNDLCAHLTGPVHSSSSGSKGKPRGGSRGQSSTHSSAKVDDSVSLDGLTEIEEEASRLRFADDDRVHEVCRLLRSSCGVYLRLEKAPEVSDLDHRHKLQMRLLALCRRSLACPVGRGALALGSLTPLMAEALPCPPLSLFGRIPPNNTPLLLSTVTAPEDLSLWPEFHNGVAAGLRVSSPKDNVPNISSSSAGVPRSTGASTVTRNWIVYNRTATGDDSSFHAGVLLALGLQGHLRVLSVTDICDYLTQGNQPTTIALLVGLPASRLGTADPLLSKTLCLHVPSLLPPQHWDIEILPQVQTAALVGLGLLYSNSGHRLMTEFLLAELGRRPTTDRDRGDCREAVSFAAAWALGVVLLGKGKGNKETETTERIVGGLDGLTDLCIEDRLYQHLEGGKRPPDSNLFPYAGVPQGDGHAAGGRSSRVMEGDQLNTGVTGPGAAVALGLIYIRSGNEEICNRLTLPQTAFALESIRPDLLLYRAVARCLVLWEAIDPTDAWIDTQTPEAVTRSLFPSKIPVEGTKMYRRENRKVELDPRSALAVYLNVVTGHCWGIGLVFAGTANDKARDTLLGKLRMLQMFRDNKQPFPLSFTPNTKTLRPLVESCIGTVALALSCVMAGTGDLSCLRILRFLRWKVDDVTYGTHMALAMAIGLLFLSGGSASLRRDPMSCACLLLATAPRFPIRTVDNQYHLQALRHLYVLAVEARALQIIDADTGCAVSVDIEVVLVSGELLAKRAPCLLPELVTVRSVSLPSSSPTSSLYYPASMVVTSLEAGSQSHIPHPLFVKRRPSSSLPSREINLTHVTRDSLAAVESCNGFSPSIKRCQSASQSLMSSLKSRLAGGKQQSTVMRARTELGSLHVAGLLESHLGLDYLLLAASETLKERPWGIKNDSKPRGIEMTAEAAASPSRNDLVGGIDSRESFSGTSKHSRMNDISLALSAIGPLTHHIFLQAMSESIVAEK